MDVRKFRLGRIEHHDPRSKGFRATGIPKLRDVKWINHGAILDQGNLGSCVGNAAAAWLNHSDAYLAKYPVCVEDDAVEIYTHATTLDPFPGQYPPRDTGTTALAAAKYLKAAGRISAYTHAFGLSHTVSALMLSPVLLGTVWTEDMFTPNRYGTVYAEGAEQGGHEYLAVGYEHHHTTLGFPIGYVWCQNSWGTGWGKAGLFRMHTRTLDQLLKAKGDAMVLQV